MKLHCKLSVLLGAMLVVGTIDLVAATEVVSCDKLNTVESVIAAAKSNYEKRQWEIAEDCFGQATKINRERTIGYLFALEDSFSKFQMGLILFDSSEDEAREYFQGIDKDVGPLVDHLVSAHLLLNRDRLNATAVEMRKLGDAFRNRKQKAEAAMAYALGAFIGVHNLYVNSKLGEEGRERWLEEIWKLLKEALELDHTHNLANYLAGFLRAWDSTKNFPSVIPGKAEKRADEGFAKNSFPQGGDDLYYALVPDVKDEGVTALARRRAGFIRDWVRERIVKFNLNDTEGPKIFVAGWDDGGVIKTSHDPFLLCMEASDDTSLASVTITWQQLLIPLPMEASQRSYKGCHAINFVGAASGQSLPIKIEASDKAGKKSSFNLTMEYKSLARKLHVYLVGIEEYQTIDPSRRTPTGLKGLTSKDIDPLASYFQNTKRWWAYGSIEIVPYKNEVKLNTLFDIFNKIGNLSDKDDVLFYFSGHGDRKLIGQPGEYSCLVVQDGCAPIKSLLQIIERASIQDIAIVLDACYAGDPQELNSLDIAESTQERNLLAASGENETAKFDENLGSLFTQILLDVLRDDTIMKNLDPLGHGFVTVREASGAVRERLESMWRAKNMRRQETRFLTPKGQQKLGWRPKEAVALHVIELFERDMVGDPDVLKTIKGALNTPGQSTMKTIAVQILTDYAYYNIESQQAYDVVKGFEAFFSKAR